MSTSTRNQKRKAALLINAFTAGGAERVVSSLLSSWMGRDVVYEVLCLEKNIEYQLPKGIKVTYLSGFTGQESGIFKLLMIPVFAWRLARYVRKHDFTIVQSHIYRSNYVNILAKLFGGRQLVQCVTHGVVSRYKSEGLLGKINLFLIKHLYPKADLLIHVTKIVKDDLNALFPLQVEQLVIHNPCSIDEIQTLAKEPVDGCEFDPTRQYLICVGRLISLKRIGDVIQSLSDMDENVHLIVLGDGCELEALKATAESAGCGDRVFFLGRVDNPFKYMARADLLVVASESESFGNVIIESFACGTPAISSKCGGPEEIMGLRPDSQLRGESGYVVAEYGPMFDIGNTEQLREAANYLLSQPEESARLSKVCAEHAGEFQLSKIAARYAQVLGVS